GATARRGRDLGEQREQPAPGARVCRVVPAVLALARVEGAVVARVSRGLAGSGVRPFSRRLPSAIAPSAHALGTGRDGPAARFMAASGGQIVKTVAQLLRTKGHGVLSVSPELSVFEALTVLAEKRVWAPLVLEGERL